MESNTLPRLPSHQFLSPLLISLSLLSFFPNTLTVTASACNSRNYTTTPTPSSNYKNFIVTSCNSSTYPSLCFHSLSPYASRIQADHFKLCNVSLSLALKAAVKTSSVISDILSGNHFTEAATAVLQDCRDNVEDSTEELSQALEEMTHLEKDDVDREFHISTIKTEVSAAITDDETCSDGFDEQNVDAAVRDKIRKRVMNARRMTSNALYFINNLLT